MSSIRVLGGASMCCNIQHRYNHNLIFLSKILLQSYSLPVKPVSFSTNNTSDANAATIDSQKDSPLPPTMTFRKDPHAQKPSSQHLKKKAKDILLKRGGSEFQTSYLYSHALTVLDPKTSFVAKKLSRKYSPEDFLPKLNPHTNRYQKPKYSARYLGDLKKDALTCGLDPVLDLNLPASVDRLEEPYVSPRLKKELKTRKRQEFMMGRLKYMPELIKQYREKRKAERMALKNKVPF